MLLIALMWERMTQVVLVLRKESCIAALDGGSLPLVGTFLPDYDTYSVQKRFCT